MPKVTFRHIRLPHEIKGVRQMRTRPVTVFDAMAKSMPPRSILIIRTILKHN